MIIRQPKASEDRPAIVTSSVVGVLCLGAGLWLAHAAMGHPAPQVAEAESVEIGRPPAELEGELETAGDEGAGDETAGDEAAGDEAAGDEAAGDETAGDETATPVPEAAPPPVAPAPVTPAPATPAPLVLAPRPPPPTGTGVATRITHGRVAYLRCDGAPIVSGPFPCPRDAALEDSVWGAIDQALACDPPLPPGQADLVVEFDRASGAATPAISTRDTFPDDALRTDAAAVVTCLTPALSTLTTTITGDRIRVGFRFELR